MKRLILYLFKQLILCLLLALVLSCSKVEEADITERTKIALRNVGDQLLLSHKDSTSLVLPVKKIESNTFQFTFSKDLSFEPNTLVTTVKNSFEAAQLPDFYRVEVLLCKDREVAYSYQMSAVEERVITPCSGRYLPKACYIIQVEFVNIVEMYSIKDALIHFFILLVLLSVVFVLKIKSKPSKPKQDDETKEKLGGFYFYPEQNKLVKEAVEIALSKKECEILSLFAANPNTIIKREELTKRVWEDNGVFVGRSLDTYISKLRKKLKSDTSLKLTNVHGVGYKLEVSK